ncbi:MAG: DUF3008 family protein [bacterium]
MKNINEKSVKPTFDEPQTAHGVEFNDNFNKTMTKQGLNIKALDEKLDKDKLEVKKKIFSLPKMEALVHSDPKLSAIYDEMAEEGKSLYGYHANETINNLIFNDYVLNSPKYIQKYKQAIPVKKKRRDKSGIEQLKKQGKDIEKRRKELEKERKSPKREVNESTPASNAGAFSTKAGDTGNYESNTIDTKKEWEELIKAEISQIAKEKTYNKNKKGSKNPVDSTNYVGGSSAKPSWEGGKIINNPNNILNESDMNDLESIKRQAKETSKKEGVAQHVNKVSDNKYKISDFYDSDSTVISYENGRELNEQGIEETTSASSAAGAGSSYVGYAGPSAWGSGELTKGKKAKKDKDSFWDGGKLVKESNYLTDPQGFEKIFNALNEEIDRNNIITTPEEYKQLVQQRKSEGKKLSNEDVTMLGGQALYDLAIRIANQYLPLSWDDLPDINSMWDYIDENGGMTLKELASSVKEAVNDRLSEDGMSLDDLMENRPQIDEHHLETREDKIRFILSYLGDEYNTEELNNLNDLEIDELYRDVERAAGIAEQRLKEELVNEKAKSKSQQQAAGMALAAKRGNMDVEDLKGAAKQMYDSMSADELEDFAETKHKGLPDKVKENELTEHHLESREDKLNFIVNAMNQLVPGLFDPRIQREIWNELPDNKLDLFYKTTEKQLQKAGINPMSIELGEDKLREHHLNTTEDKIEYLSKVLTMLSNNKFNFSVDELNKLAIVFDDDFIDDMYKQAEEELRNRMIDPVTLTSMNEESMIDDNETSMKIKPPIGTNGSSMPSGMDVGGPMSENTRNMEESINKFEKELKLFEMHHKKLQEDRKPSTLVMKDRLGSENEKNFKKDLSHSGTKETIDVTKELQYKDEQTTIDKPQELSQKIEKEVLKNTGGESFKNVGNSTNNEGDEIPKRNLTDDESETVDKIRQGLGDYVYDNKPDERFEERMKRDMGDELYKKRQEKLKFKADAPLYNKDTQPVDDGIEKVQFDKQKSGWNEKYGIKESSVTGKYKDDLGKTKFIDFKLNEVNEVFTVPTDDWKELTFEGLGNTYDKKTNINEDVSSAINGFKFYIDGKTVFAKKNDKMSLTESENKEKSIVNEQFNKMKHLFGYNPKDFTDTRGIKL